MISDIRVGIPIIGSKGWLGGVSHIEMHVKAVASLPKNERPLLYLIATDDTFESFLFYQPFISIFENIIYVGDNLSSAKKILGPSILHSPTQEDLFNIIDFYFPVSFNVIPDKCSASWIHDFQHKYLPELFQPQVHTLRDNLCQYIADNAKLAFCSSKAVEKDFRKFYPSSKTITKVLALRIFPEKDWYTGNPIEVQRSYKLPNRFVLCSNQFWLHKNHRKLFEAIALLRQSDQEVHLVCTGSTSDFRSPNYFQELQKYTEELGITDLVHILGLIPRLDQIQLIRRSLFVVQPSLFEGLSLIVQECRALGKAIILSDLDVHLEHEYGIYFNRTDAQDLADKMNALLLVAQPGPDIPRETEAKMQAIGLARIYAKQFCSLCEESQIIFDKKPSKLIHHKNKKPDTIPIVTSITSIDDCTDQQKAITSWLNLGFRVVSLNTPQDISLLQPKFPNVEFVEAARNGSNTYQKSYIYFDDIVNYINNSDIKIAGIAEPDIHLYKPDFYAFVSKEAVNSLIWGAKTDIKSLEEHSNPILSDFGYCFIDKQLLSCYPKEEFYLGLPWWDYWAVLMPLTYRFTVKKVITPLAFRITKPADYELDAWIKLGLNLSKYAASPFPLSLDTISKYHKIISTVINKYSTNVEFN